MKIAGIKLSRKPKSYFAGVLLVVCILVITGFSQRVESRGDINEALVSDVVDGDTIMLVGGRRLRYIGINTPEIMKRFGARWQYAPEPFAQKAKDYNRALIGERKIRLEYDKDKEDAYGRLLAYAYNYNGEMINSKMISEGYASVYTFPPNVKYYDLFLKAQEEAIANRRGIWSGLEVISAGEALGHIGEYRIVRGLVTDVLVLPQGIFFYFGPEKSGLFRAVIFIRNLSLFKEKGIDPESEYLDKHVELTGRIESAKGAQMILDNPSQIKVIEQ